MKRKNLIEEQYQDNMAVAVNRTLALAKSKTISARIAVTLINFLIRKDANYHVQHYIEHILHDQKREKLLFVNYESKSTNYLV